MLERGVVVGFTVHWIFDDDGLSSIEPCLCSAAWWPYDAIPVQICTKIETTDQEERVKNKTENVGLDGRRRLLLERIPATPDELTRVLVSTSPKNE